MGVSDPGSTGGGGGPGSLGVWVSRRTVGVTGAHRTSLPTPTVISGVSDWDTTCRVEGRDRVREVCAHRRT